MQKDRKEDTEGQRQQDRSGKGEIGSAGDMDIFQRQAEAVSAQTEEYGVAEIADARKSPDQVIADADNGNDEELGDQLGLEPGQKRGQDEKDDKRQQRHGFGKCTAAPLSVTVHSMYPLSA